MTLPSGMSVAPTAPPFPGLPTTADGATTVVWVETHITEAAGAYPITSSTTMGGGYQLEVANGKRNLWGTPLAFLEPESEHSSATVCEGFALAGGRVTNFTSGQGLVLMKEVLYTISGKRLPVVFHIGARALTSHSLNVHAGHDDVMAVSDVGWGILWARNAQEAGDLALIARRAAEATETPFLNVQDGFLTTHTIENVLLPEPELMRDFVGNPRERLRNLFDPENPLQSGVVQNQDSYMKGKVAQRYFYDRVAPTLERVMAEYTRLTGRRYDMVSTYRMDDADYALVALGSMAETAEATVDWLRQQLGWKAGVVHLTSFRPFPGPQVAEALKGVEAVAVVERMDNPLAQSNPLTLEVKAALADALMGTPGYPRLHCLPTVYSGSAGLGSRDVQPADLAAAISNMRRSDGLRSFTLGIQHPMALEPEPEYAEMNAQPAGAFAMRGHSIGGFGSVTTNKVIATILGDLFGLYVQAYPLYGSEKKGLPTTYYLVVADEHIRTHSELKHVDFVPLNDANAFNLGNPLSGLRPGGMVFLQSSAATPEAIWQSVPAYARRQIREKGVRLLALDTLRIAREVASAAELRQRMQGIVLLGVFLRYATVVQRRQLSDEEVLAGVERSLRKYFGKRGEQVVKDNLEAVRRGYTEALEVPRSLMEAELAEPAGQTMALPQGLKVEDVMHRGVITCQPATPVAEVAQTMTEHGISAVVVVDAQGFALGIVSSTDLANTAFLAPDQRFDALCAEHLMTSPVIATTPEQSLDEAIRTIRERHIHRLVVVEAMASDHLKPVGILSVTDLVRELGELEPGLRGAVMGQALRPAKERAGALS